MRTVLDMLAHMKIRRRRNQFGEWLDARHIPDSEAAHAMGASQSGVYRWRNCGTIIRDAVVRDMIARYTNGDIPAESWITPDDRHEIAAVKPWVAPKTAPSSARKAG